LYSDYDVIIVGAGLGGSACAFALRDSGLSVLVLERGPFLKQEHENWEPHEVITKRRYDPDETWEDESGQEFSPRIYYNVGGNSKFFGGVALRFRPGDFAGRSYADGDTVRWPIEYDDLAPYYGLAERSMWVPGVLEHEPDIAWLADRLSEQGLNPLALPMAIDQGPAGRCQKGSPCDGFPCKIRAKGDGENAFLRPAVREFGRGSLEIRTGVTVSRLVESADGNTVSRVECLEDGRPAEYRGRAVVLAAGAANSAAILLRSATPDKPGGICNGSDQVGRNFMAHNNTVLMAFSPFRQNRTRFQKTLCFNDFYEPTSGVQARGHIQMRGKVVEANLRKSPRPLVRLFARWIARRSFDFWIMTEDLADGENRVELTADRLRLSRKLNNLEPHRFLVSTFRKHLRKAGLPIVIEREPSPRTIQHQVGTLRMGSNPATSVVDPDCRSHEVTNLYVADGSVFPSSAAVNPALTIAANALRVGDAIKRDLSRSG
jgi:choline dehydrogenase-like flavoprotein